MALPYPRLGRHHKYSSPPALVKEVRMTYLAVNTNFILCVT